MHRLARVHNATDRAIYSIGGLIICGRLKFLESLYCNYCRSKRVSLSPRRSTNRLKPKLSFLSVSDRLPDERVSTYYRLDLCGRKIVIIQQNTLTAHRPSAMRCNYDINWPVHFLMLTFHDLRSLPLRHLPSTVSCSMTLGSVS